MKVIAYIRVAKTNSRKGYRVDASTKANYRPLSAERYPGPEFFPTVLVGVELDVPDEAFEAAMTTVEVPRDHAVPLVGVESRPVESEGDFVKPDWDGKED